MTPQPEFSTAVSRVLRPLVKLLISKGFNFTQLSELLKGVYVEVAEQDFPLTGKSQTDSRIHLLTGVHRKDVKRLRGQSPSSHHAPEAVTLGAQAVALWTSSPEYLDPSGQPRALPRRAAPGQASFESLIESISKDIRPRAVLDEWLRLGVVELDADGQVRLVTAAFIPQKGEAERLFYFAHTLHDHIASGVHNLSGALPPAMERSVHYSALTPEALEEVKALAEKKGMEALHAVNARCRELATEAGEHTRRLTFGVYFHEAPSAEEPAHAKED